MEIAMRFWKKIFEDDNGNPSYIRFSSFLLVIAFIADWVNTSIIRGELFDPAYSIVMLIFGVLGIKAWQKGIENKQK